MKKCVQYQKTPAGRRCEKYEAPATPEQHSIFDGFSAAGVVAEVNPLQKAVNSTDVLVGAAVGPTLTRLVVFGLGKVGVRIPAMLAPYANLLGGFVGGSLAYFAQRGSNPVRGQGHMIGAIAGGIVADVAPKIAGLLPASFGGYGEDYVDVSLGLMQDEVPAMGAFVDDRAMGQMAALSMYDGEDDDGLEALVDADSVM